MILIYKDEGEEKEQTVNELTVSEKAHADKKLELEQCRQNMKDCKLEKRNKENKVENNVIYLNFLPLIYIKF